MQQLGPLLGRGARPRRERRAAAAAAASASAALAPRGLADDLLGGRVDDVVGAVAALDPLAADEQPVRTYGF